MIGNDGGGGEEMVRSSDGRSFQRRGDMLLLNTGLVGLNIKQCSLASRPILVSCRYARCRNIADLLQVQLISRAYIKRNHMTRGTTIVRKCVGRGSGILGSFPLILGVFSCVFRLLQQEWIHLGG